MSDDTTAVYLSRAGARAWSPDDDVGGFAHMIFDHGPTKVGLWRANVDGPRGPVEVPIPSRETLYVIEGRVRVAIDRGERISLDVGDILSIPANALVGWDADPDCVVLWVYS